MFSVCTPRGSLDASYVEEDKRRTPYRNGKVLLLHTIHEERGARAMSGRKFFRKLVRNLLCLSAGLLAFAACAYTDYRLWPLDLPARRYPAFPAPKIQHNRLVFPFAPGIASAKVATFHDQLEAFLHFEYLRGREARDGS